MMQLTLPDIPAHKASKSFNTTGTMHRNHPNMIDTDNEPASNPILMNQYPQPSKYPPDSYKPAFFMSREKLVLDDSRSEQSELSLNIRKSLDKIH